MGGRRGETHVMKQTAAEERVIEERGEGRREKGDGRWEMGDGRRELGDGIRSVRYVQCRTAAFVVLDMFSV